MQRTLALLRVLLRTCLDVDNVGLLHEFSRYFLGLIKTGHCQILRFQRTASLVKLQRSIEFVVKGQLRAYSGSGHSHPHKTK